MTGLPANAWVPVVIPWGLVRVGDVFVGMDSDTGEATLWHVDTVALDGADVLVQVNGSSGKPYRIPRDTKVNILAEAPRAALSDADAADIIRAQITCTLIEQRAPHAPAA